MKQAYGIKARSLLTVLLLAGIMAAVCFTLNVSQSFAAEGTAKWVTEQNSAGQITSVKLDMSSMAVFDSFLVYLYKDGVEGSPVNVTTPVYDVTDQILKYDSGEFSAKGFAMKTGVGYVEFETSSDLKFYTITINKQGHGNNVKLNHIKDGSSVKTALSKGYISTFNTGGDDSLMRFYENGEAFMGVALHPLSNYSDITALKAEACYMLPGGSGKSYTLGGDVMVYDQWFKVITDVDLTVQAPVCGSTTTISKSGSEWDWNSQTNTPVVTVPEGKGYHYDSTAGAPGSWWIESVENDGEPYSGSFTGGNTYAFQSCLSSDFGYVFPTDKDTIDLTVKVNGKTIPRANAYNGDMPYSFSVIGEGTVPLTIDGTVSAVHNEVIDPEVAATCTTDGVSAGSHCGACNLVLKEQTVILGGHKWSEGYIVDQEPSCTEKGSQHKVCTSCNTPKESEPIAALGHNEVPHSNTRATLTEDGMTGGTYCDRCNEELTAPATISRPNAFTLSPVSYVYNGSARKPAVTVKDAQGAVIAPANYSVAYANNVKAGKASATVTFKGDYYTGNKTLYYTINKAANPLKIKARTATVKYKAVKKKAQTLAVTKVITFTKKGQGTMSYTKASGNAKITIVKKTGKVTVKKGLKKGTYKVKVKVKAAGNGNYKPSAAKTVTFKVIVK